MPARPPAARRRASVCDASLFRPTRYRPQSPCRASLHALRLGRLCWAAGTASMAAVFLCGACMLCMHSLDLDLQPPPAVPHMCADLPSEAGGAGGGSGPDSGWLEVRPGEVSLELVGTQQEEQQQQQQHLTW